MAMSEECREAFEEIPYRRADHAAAFKELHRDIRVLLEGAVGPRYRRLTKMQKVVERQISILRTPLWKA